MRFLATHADPAVSPQAPQQFGLKVAYYGTVHHDERILQHRASAAEGSGTEWNKVVRADNEAFRGGSFFGAALSLAGQESLAKASSTGKKLVAWYSRLGAHSVPFHA